MRVQLARAKQKFLTIVLSSLFYHISLDQGAMFFYLSNHELYFGFSQLDREFWKDG